MRLAVAPASSSLALAASASSLEAPSRMAFGAASTSSLASFRPRPGTISRTALMTPIFLAPASSRTTSNSDCSSASAAPASPPAAPAAATATGAAASTSKTSSNSLTNSESSMRVISLKASMSSSLESLAMVASFLLWGRSVRTPKCG
ncbi:50S ribosomal protein L7/L12 [Corynebacterium maris DSM 45190]|uniref:50S ribosomal protein L7/L12 n=1 Tax=Corynebacterium maris DSM 45190 TaxID=1224163 RepID=S5TGB9_9CORY|nr:50S ribosomal protein L7/L12 [Corynebacterium maris DSM 45190]